ncbi:phenylalanine 4-monooxygenase [Lujinxingia litoralis]|uniref:Phenylalanine 4-monooxygenase n=1 Tax=Lujinxingia litoralis TaxID=2211119 RepID=A0A328C2Q7_9DELT|nr:phenylalanine 4-monooxygenase [Lujinxingia litoralis]RAL20997.1 phenylalanine 4-monooxygenase [Lujinxingia litoralis]
MERVAQDQELEGLKMEGAGFISHEGRTYTAEENAVWKILCERRMQKLPETACEAWLKGLEKLKMPLDRVPLFDELNDNLRPLTSWELRAVNGFIPAEMFFGSMAKRQFPSTLEIRPMDRLEYLQEPDIFHDVFGHVPMHTDPVFADFVQEYGELVTELDNRDKFDAMARLWWYTVEFGLVQEAGRVKLYGSGLMSSFGEADNVFDGGPEIRPFDLDEVISTPFRIDIYQPIFWVAEGFDQLRASVQELRRRWAEELVN